MTTAAQNLLKQARKLSADDRIVLAHNILRTVEDEEDVELTDEHVAEVLRRREEHLKNPKDVVKWAQVEEEMRPRKK